MKIKWWDTHNGVQQSMIAMFLNSVFKLFVLNKFIIFISMFIIYIKLSKLSNNYFQNYGKKLIFISDRFVEK